MNCPNCSSELRITYRYDAEVDYCPTCKGAWLDRGEIDRIANTQRRIEEDHYNKYHRKGDRYHERHHYDYDYDDDDDYYRRRYGPGRNGRGFLQDLFDFD
jgi:Zn-finger nucleic acid-binding protein